MTLRLGLMALGLCLLASPALAVDLGRPDAHAPIGVMGDHVHHEGEFMLSYRYMNMHMDGNRDGNDRVSREEVLRDFLVAPTEMNMEMHMVGAMYAPKDWITLMIMIPFVQIEMDHITRMGQRFTTRSKGIGDITTSALVKLWEEEAHQVHANIGFSWPSGSIDREDNTPASMGNDVTLPYPMQIGSGSVELLPGLTYNGQMELFSWGAQGMGTIRLHENEQDYRVGNEYMLTGWASVKPLRWVSGGVRLQWRQWFDVEGEDSRIPGVMGRPPETTVPTADPNLRGGQQLDIGPSVNFLVPEGVFKGVRLAFEFLVPIHRKLDGPQLETDWTLTAGVQYAF